MEIILKEDIVNLGYKNDIVTVKSGYGRNYLIPTGKAVIASPAAKKMLAEDLKQRAHKLEKIKKDAEALAAKLEGVSLKIATKVSSTGTIFGSASPCKHGRPLPFKSGICIIDLLYHKKKCVAIDPVCIKTYKKPLRNPDTPWRI